MVRRAMPVVLGLLRIALPSRRHVLVCGYPPIEGNVIELVRSLARRYPGQVVWLRSPSERTLQVQGICQDRLIRVSRYSFRALWHYVTAEAVFFTHGLYGEPAALARKPTFNLWHGAGPKATNTLFPERRLHSKPSDFYVSISDLWGRQCVRASGLSESSLLLTGHPRNDAMFRSGEHAYGLDGLDLSDGRPFVLWMPAYRRAGSSSTMRAFVDAATDPSRAALQTSVLVQSLKEAGYRVVVKPHPLDGDDYEGTGAILVTDDDLESKGQVLAQLLAASSGLVTDYSSVATDYVLLDRPIGFHFYDLHEYENGRGLYPADFASWIPGTDVTTPEGMSRFLEDLRSGGSETRDSRKAFIRRAGIVTTRTAADDLLDSIRQVSKSRFARAITERTQDDDLPPTQHPQAGQRK